MKAPVNRNPLEASFVVHEGKRIYSQIDDLLLKAFELDAQEPNFGGLASIGQMVARIREAEVDRDALRLPLTLLLQEVLSDPQALACIDLRIIKSAEAALKRVG